MIADPQFQADSTSREAALDGVRYHINHLSVDPEFAKLLNDRVAAVFGAKKIRLRSSTNAEDLETFSGAGLYESVSAYATGDKVASAQVRKVWASVWNWRAFEERSYWNIDHHSVRMAVAVHQAFPEEAANGVLITQNIVDPIVAGMYVNVQKGEVSVTNPEGGALPEVFSIIPAPAGTQNVRRSYSTLSPSAPILTDAEIQNLFGAARKIQYHFAPLYRQDANALALDLEFKFHGTERALFIKQVRPYAQTAF
jgi:phosphoenolpyruvate synthase/pyruvate phosphate dikinase